MEDYPDLDWQTAAAQRRLCLAAMLETRDAGTTAEEVAATFGYSRQHAYVLARKARDALKDATPGPKTQQEDPDYLPKVFEELSEENESLRLENDRLNQKFEDAVFVDERR